MPDIIIPEITVIPDWTHFLIQISSTLILFVVIKMFAWAPIKEFLKKRQEIIAAELNQAEVVKEEALALKQDFETQLKGAKEEARKIVEDSKNQAKMTHNQILANAQEEAKQKMAKASMAIEQERRVAYAQMKEDLVNISVSSTEMLIKKEIDEEVHQELFNDFVAKVGGSNE